MANRTLSDLPVTLTPAGANITHIRQSGIDKSLTLTKMAEYILNDSDYAPVVVSISGNHVIDTTIRKQLIIATISGDIILTFPGTYGDAQEIIVRNNNTSTANVTGFPDGLILYPEQEVTYIWNGSAFIRKINNEIIKKTNDPLNENISPEYLGQKYVDTSTGILYISNGNEIKDWHSINKSDYIGNLYVDSGNIVIDESYINGMYLIQENITTIGSLAANTWYFTVIREDTFEISIIAMSSVTWGSWAPSLVNNQLDLLNLYDNDKNYCRYESGGIGYRILYVFRTNAGITGFDDKTCMKIKNKPLSYCFLYSSTVQFISPAGVVYYIDFPTLDIDTLSEIAGGATDRKFISKETKKITSCFISSIRLRNSTLGGNVTLSQYTYKNNVSNSVVNFENLGNSTDLTQTSFCINLHEDYTIKKNDIIDYRYSSSALNPASVVLAETVYNFASGDKGTSWIIQEVE